jgi:hypothetical protein
MSWLVSSISSLTAACRAVSRSARSVASGLPSSNSPSGAGSQPLPASPWKSRTLS